MITWYLVEELTGSMDTLVETASAINVCPLCGPVPLRWRFHKKGREFWSCPRCGISMQRPLPTVAELQTYYDAQYASGMYKTFADASEMKAMTARRRLHEISPRVPFSGRWLDVGSADGAFVREARRLGIEAEGIELSEVAAQKARAAGLPVRQGALEDTPRTPGYDCITAFDVLEHVIDPSAFLSELATRLGGGGHAVLTMPDTSSIFSRVMGARWWFYIPDEHLHYFDPVTIRAMMTRAGLETVVVSRTYKPLTFDYGLTQFVEYNPWIYRAMKFMAHVLPKRLRTHIVPVYIGEMKVIARKGGVTP